MNMHKIIILLSLLTTACTTPETVMKNNQTGQVSRCGGNVAVFGILYPFMRAADSQCVADYSNEGFKPVGKE